MSVPTASPSRLAVQTRLAVLPQWHHWIVVPVIIGVITLALGFAVKWVPSIASTEFGSDKLLDRTHNAVFNAIALVINTVLAPPGILVILVLLFLFLLLFRKSPVNAVAVCSVAAIGWLSSEVFKVIVSQPRPDQYLLQNVLVAGDGSDSFPSGHTTFAVSLAIALYFLARNTEWSKLVFVVVLVFALTVAVSRVYLGVHYPSDTVGSFLVAGTAISFYTGLWNRYGLWVLNRVPLLNRFGPIPREPGQ
jgi:membrane-associated phospholipid phosphatase